jgi:hypothetical protein
MNVNDLATNLQLDGNNLTGFDNTTVNANVGIYITDRENALDVCQKLASSVGAYVITDITGKLKLVRLETDFVGTATYEVTREDMEETSLQISEKLDVEGSVKLAYCKNWTVQETGLAGGIPSNNVALFAKEWWYSITKDATTLSRYQQNAEPPQKDTQLITTANADAESLRLLNIKKSPRFIYTATYFSHLLLVELGDYIKITYPRFGLDLGKTGMVVSIERDWLRGRVNIGVLV